MSERRPVSLSLRVLALAVCLGLHGDALSAQPDRGAAPKDQPSKGCALRALLANGSCTPSENGRASG